MRHPGVSSQPGDPHAINWKSFFFSFEWPLKADDHFADLIHHWLLPSSPKTFLTSHTHSYLSGLVNFSVFAFPRLACTNIQSHARRIASAHAMCLPFSVSKPEMSFSIQNFFPSHLKRKTIHNSVLLPHIAVHLAIMRSARRGKAKEEEEKLNANISVMWSAL